MTVKQDWKVDFEAFLVKSGRSEATAGAYLSDVAQFARWFRENEAQRALKPGLITNYDLREYRDNVMSQYKPATWNRRRAMLLVLCAWAVEQGLMAYNPMDGIEAADEVELPPRWLCENDFKTIMRYLERAVNTSITDYARWQAVRDWALAAVMVYAGLRVGEVVALNAGDLEISERKGVVVVRSGKGEKRREIPLNAKARRILTLWLEAGRDREGVGLFYGKRGERMSTRAVQRRFVEIGYHTRIEELTPHVLRHTFAKRLVDGGAPLNWVSKLMGHSNLETTARYTQAGWEDYENAVEGL